MRHVQSTIESTITDLGQNLLYFLFLSTRSPSKASSRNNFPLPSCMAAYGDDGIDIWMKTGIIIYKRRKATTDVANTEQRLMNPVL